jgi:hypothetical protein
MHNNGGSMQGKWGRGPGASHKIDGQFQIFFSNLKNVTVNFKDVFANKGGSAACAPDLRLIQKESEYFQENGLIPHAIAA